MPVKNIGPYKRVNKAKGSGENDPDALSDKARVELCPPQHITVVDALALVFDMAEEMCGAKHPELIAEWLDWVSKLRELTLMTPDIVPDKIKGASLEYRREPELVIVE